jgi:ubiquinone/menaquinone biosynthesis C-methylase UbiE/uncharacterized protein YbaR (Trm112 family)
MRKSDVARLACPLCRARLSFRGKLRSGHLHDGQLTCARCRAGWRVEDGLCHLYQDESVQGKDRLLRGLYDRLGFLHDAAVRYTLPLTGAGTEEEFRRAYVERLELRRRPKARRPLRILEVGVGTGADLAGIRAALPARSQAEVWGVELSIGMLEQCRSRLRADGDRSTRLLLADVHALPFPDATFDRVLHVGAMNSFRDPARALAEMARVAVGGAPVVVVDEQLDRTRDHSAVQRAFFRLITFYEPYPHCPREHLPPGVTRVTEEQLGRFFYCLSFRVPGRRRRATAA